MNSAFGKILCYGLQTNKSAQMNFYKFRRILQIFKKFYIIIFNLF
jgi:hypothetical protein